MSNVAKGEELRVQGSGNVTVKDECPDIVTCGKRVKGLWTQCGVSTVAAEKSLWAAPNHTAASVTAPAASGLSTVLLAMLSTRLLHDGSVTDSRHCLVTVARSKPGLASHFCAGEVATTKQRDCSHGIKESVSPNKLYLQNSAIRSERQTDPLTHWRQNRIHEVKMNQIHVRNHPH